VNFESFQIYSGISEKLIIIESLSPLHRITFRIPIFIIHVQCPKLSKITHENYFKVGDIITGVTAEQDIIALLNI